MPRAEQQEALLFTIEQIEKYVSTEYNPVLMSSSHPAGHALENLLQKLQHEIEAKTEKIKHDTSLLSKTIQNNNLQIIGLLKQAEALQRQSYALLDNKSPYEGPLGTPRIG